MTMNRAIWTLPLSLVLAVAPGAAQRAPVTPNLQKTDVLRQLSTSFEEISSRSGRAVVQIFARSYVANDDSQNDGELLTAQNSSGSGIILSPDGYILTNSHVVKGAHTLRVQLNMRTAADLTERGYHGLNRSLPATLVGIDRETDLAVIKIDQKDLPFLEFGDSNALKQGQLVLALGNPLGLDNSVSLGVVSAVSRQLKPDDAMAYIQTDAPINPGNSGGPLVDADGHVVGINTFILTQSGGSEGIGFSIPSNVAKQVYTQLKAQGHVHRAQLGLIGQTITPQMAEGLGLETDHGVIVSDLEPDGPAADAGIQRDDIILAIDGRHLESERQLTVNVYRDAPGKRVVLLVQRGEQKMDIPVETAEKTHDLDSLADLVDPVKNVVPELGIVGIDINKTILQLLPDLRRPQGVVVAARKANTPYSGPPLETGDVIYQVNHDVVANVAQLRQELESMKSGAAAVLLIERDSHLIYVPLELD
ncbi:MAG TPA: trypsin-like peptidase domain-containing protein [Bryobacteraceae bacterium]|jgi:serine protease Do|nr:trypsin-like peptidase domain-containing protein [Bryobacteraceae bacterium]